MANQSFYSSYDARRDSNRQMQSVFRQATVLTYDAIKFLVNFIASMGKMIMGK